MKNILISIRPEWCKKILNGEKTIEVRKTFPNCKLPAKVYIYCSKGKNKLFVPYEINCFNEDETSKAYIAEEPILENVDYLANGKVIAEFKLNVGYGIPCQALINNDDDHYHYKTITQVVEKSSCLTYNELKEYANGKTLYFWQILSLKIYDKPKELKDFMVTDEEKIKKCPYRSRVFYKNSNNGIIPTSYACDCCNKEDSCQINWCNKCLVKPLEKAPQSWCYVKENKDERAKGIKIYL